MSNDITQAHDTDNLPPDRGTQGDVSTTGYDTHDAQNAHDAHDTHDAQGGHGGHGDDSASELPTLVPTTWAQLILPVIILIVVALLVVGPVFNAFASRPNSVPPSEQQTSGQSTTGSSSEGGQSTPTAVPSTATPQSLVVPPTATQPASPTAIVSQFVPVAATQTAVAIAGESGEVTRVPVRLEIGGRLYDVLQGSGLLPDWQPSQDESKATWIQGTVANHILYVPFSPANEALFKSARTGEIVKLTMNTGQVFSFAITRADRAVNGPAPQGQLSVSAAMAQDHAGLTLFLTGDPAADRAVVLADFTGTIQ